MKTAIATITTVALLTGCTIDRRTVVTETTSPPTTETPATNSQSYTDEDKFIAGVDELHIGPIYSTDRELIETGRGVCDAAYNGVTAQEMSDTAWQASEGDESIYDLLVAITVSAIMFLCPEYTYILERNSL